MLSCFIFLNICWHLDYPVCYTFTEISVNDLLMVQYTALSTGLV